MRIYNNSQVTGITEIVCPSPSVGLSWKKRDPKVLPLVGGGIFIILIYVHRGRLYGRDLYNCTIYTC